MKRSASFFLSVVLTCVWFTSISAQQAPPYEVEAKYDRFKDATMITVANMPVAGSILGNGVFLSALYFCIGKPQCTPQNIYLGFTVVKGNTESAMMRSIWDGVRQPAYEMQRMGEVTPISELGITGQGFAVAMKPSTFVKMANSKVVEFQLCGFEFTLKNEHLEGLRKLAGKMQ
jgi:hypothetical protein